MGAWLRLVKLSQDSELKVQGSIQGDAVRVSGAKKRKKQEKGLGSTK